MNRSAKRQHHEQARKRHRQEHEQYARAVAKKPPAAFPAWLLVAGVGALILAMMTATFAR